MQISMGKTGKNTKHARKVVLLKFDDERETLILSKVVKRKKRELTIKVECNTKRTKSANECQSKEKYPIFKAQLRERIVPCCLRAKCSKKKHLNCTRQEKSKHRKIKHYQLRKRSEVTLAPISIIDINDESNNSNKFENISSDNLSSSSDDEIEVLIKSTKKRMKDSGDGWKLVPKHVTCTTIANKSHNINMSINSLDTLVLEADETNKYSELYDLQNYVYSPTMSPETLIKSEPVETNNNNIKLEHFTMDQQSLYDNNMNKDYFEKIKIDTVVPKVEKNNYMKQELYEDII